jgi:hypothetical protein
VKGLSGIDAFGRDLLPLRNQRDEPRFKSGNCFALGHRREQT